MVQIADEPETIAEKRKVERDWEPVKEDGTIKRFSIPGGWIYGVWQSHPLYNSEGTFLGNDDWRLVNAFFVPHATVLKTKPFSRRP